ncbi:hypothetical protein HanRHA438_Chr08g0328331 [Helianthus annuus]|nr:hypothetical protein HanRHA438_Chr08g0328331 [Helianthus annuus]
MVMHMIVVTLALRVFLKNDFLTFYSNVFHKLPLTQNYLFFTFNIKLFIFCNLSSQLFLLSTLVLYNFYFPQIFSLYASFKNFVTKHIETCVFGLTFLCFVLNFAS